MVTNVLSRQVLIENAKVWSEYKGGKDASLNYLIGCGIGLSCGFDGSGECLKKITETMKELIGARSE